MRNKRTPFLLIDLAGVNLTVEDCELLKHPDVAGIVLFSRNYETVNQLKALTTHVKKCNPAAVIAIDQEGGRVQRLRQGFTNIPSMRHFGSKFLDDPEGTQRALYDTIYRAATELKSVHIDLNFAPVLDVDHGYNEMIGERSFGTSPVVARLGKVVIAASHAAGLRVAGKHFPGHGGVSEDSHHHLPVDSRSFEELESDLEPFKILSNTLDAMMPAHVVYSSLDPKPATFSFYWLTHILRKRLNFNGLIISDDLSMQAAASEGNVKRRARQALKAGCDFLLLCNQRESVGLVLDNKWLQSSGESAKRLEKFFQPCV